MLKKQITYLNEDGEKVSEDFYFNLTKLEIVEINLYDDLEEIARSKSPRRVLPALKRITKAAVGQRIANQFRKNEDYSDWFIASDANSELYMEMFEAEEPEKAIADFIKAIVPSDVSRVEPKDHLQKELSE